MVRTEADGVLALGDAVKDLEVLLGDALCRVSTTREDADADATDALWKVHFHCEDADVGGTGTVVVEGHGEQEGVGEEVVGREEETSVRIYMRDMKYFVACLLVRFNAETDSRLFARLIQFLWHETGRVNSL